MSERAGMPCRADPVCPFKIVATIAHPRDFVAARQAVVDHELAVHSYHHEIVRVAKPRYGFRSRSHRVAFGNG
jgi:hypothetical protein